MKWQYVALGIGAVLVILGIMMVGRERPSKIEIITENTEETEGTEILVHVDGAVVKPGVYELASGARINDALTAAGGLSETADRVWVKRFVNLAQKVSDGTKIYIPAAGESYTSDVSDLSDSRVNVNTASKSELESLWGIGAARAEAITANRSYSSLEDLKTKAGIPQSVLDKIKDKISF